MGRGAGRSRSRSRSRDRGRDRGRHSRSRSRERHDRDRHRRRSHSRDRGRDAAPAPASREQAHGTAPPGAGGAAATAGDAEAKRLKRLEAARLLAQRNAANAATGAAAAPAAPAAAAVPVGRAIPPATGAFALPADEPSSPVAAQRTSYVPSWIPGREGDGEGECVQEGLPVEVDGDDDEVDPLDAFMADTIMPEVAQRAAAEAAAKTEARLRRAAELAEAARLGVAPKPLADPALAELLADDDGDEEQPTEVIVVPTNKVKLIVGQGGEAIKHIQRKSKARLQVLKKEEVLTRAFGTDAEFRAKEMAEKAAKAFALAQATSQKRAKQQALMLEGGVAGGGRRGGGPALLMDSAAAAELAAGLLDQEAEEEPPPPAPAPQQQQQKAAPASQEPPSGGGGALTTTGTVAAPPKPSGQRTAPTTFAAAAAVATDTTRIALYGSVEACAIAKRMIDELFAEAAEARRDAHAAQREKEKEKKAANRRLYLLRHAADYHILGVPPGTSKDDLRKAFRKLAVIWHPDKHPEGPEREAASKKFVEIQKAFDLLMSTDEEATVEALAYT